jgi:glucosamine-6-phosphate deaminase
MTVPGAARAAPASALVLGSAVDVARLAGEIVANRLRARRGLRLLLPTGRTPLGMYAALRAHAADGSLAGSDATVFQLDEYVGLAREDPHGYRAYLDRELRGLPVATRHELAGDAPNPAAECARYQALLDEAPVDLAVLGLGRDGHVAFDEPGSLLDSGTHAVALHPTTRADAAGDFGGLEAVPHEALTIGLGTLHRARELLLLVTGSAKADALRAALLEPPGSQWPASLLRGHPRLTVVCDRAAAARLRPSPNWDSDHVAIVLGHRDAGRSAEHRISDESLERLRRAETLVRRRATRAVVLTGYTTTRGLSEAEQMEAAWAVPDTPAVLEVAGRNTAENASRSLPLVLAMGGIRRVTVVTSTWHVRAPYFFAPYRDRRLDVSFRLAHLRGEWQRMLRREAREARRMRSERSAAMRAMRPPPPLGDRAPAPEPARARAAG